MQLQRAPCWAALYTRPHAGPPTQLDLNPRAGLPRACSAHKMMHNPMQLEWASCWAALCSRPHAKQPTTPDAGRTRAQSI